MVWFRPKTRSRLTELSQLSDDSVCLVILLVPSPTYHRCVEMLADSLYLENIQEYVQDEDKIVSHWHQFHVPLQHCCQNYAAPLCPGHLQVAEQKA